MVSVKMDFLSGDERLDIILRVFTDKAVTGQKKSCLILSHFQYEEDGITFPYGHSFYDIGLWGDIDCISYTLSRLPIVHLSVENKNRIIRNRTTTPVLLVGKKTYGHRFPNNPNT